MLSSQVARGNMTPLEREALISHVGPDVADSLIRNFDVRFADPATELPKPELDKKPPTQRRRR